ncbi:MAG TPA: choice-of-anchor D domain-containing protein, partial [Anaerolineae bacterium]|nr:choice-of-anchor D domain-containing protein [Anaerolineae bacterium]
MKIRRLLFTVTLALGLTLGLLWALGGNLSYVRAATYQVTNTNSSGAGSLPQAIGAANSNPGHDTITFIPGLSGVITPTDSLTITDDVTIIGPGAEQLAVSGNNAYRVFYIGSGVAVTMTELTVRDGRATDGHIANYAEGGGIWSAGALHLDGVWLVNNTANPGFGRGGGLYVHDGSVTISGTQMFNNEASWEGGGAYLNGSGSVTVNGGRVFRNGSQSGGGIFAYGNVVLAETQIFSNVVTYDGGGLYLLDGVALVGTQVFSNVATRWGGGVYVETGPYIFARFDGTQIVSNTASEYGGGVYIANEDTTLHMTDGEINYNVAGIHGGGMYISAGTAILTGTQVISNTALADSAGGGGGAYVDQPSATLNVTDGEINENTALYGGGVYISQGSVTLRQTRVLRNTVPNFDGGGIYVEQTAATLDMSGGAIGFNSSGYEGGGVYINEGSATLIGTLVVSNTTDRGGGLYVRRGSVTLDETQVLSNSTTGGSGGGVFIEESSATLTTRGGKINDNTSGYDGGGVCVYYGRVTLGGTQISRNTANDEGGGLYIAAGDVTLNGTQIAQNTAFHGSAIYQNAGVITTTTALTITGNIHQAGGLFAGSDHDLWIEGALTLAGGHFYAPYEPNLFVLTGAYAHTGGAYHQTKSVNGSSDVSFPKAGGLIINANGQNLGSTQVVDTANGVCAGVTSGDAVRHCYLITPTLSTGRDATLAFYYLSGEIPVGQSCASMEAYRWTGAWDTMLTRDLTYGTDGRMCGSNPYSIRVVGVDAFSPFAIHQPMPADILVVPTVLDFGEQDVDAGPSLAQSVTITNSGDFDLHISAVTFSGDTDEFDLTDSGEITLTPGSTRVIEITFNPTSVGAKGALLTIASDDSDEPSVEVILSGRGVQREIVVAPTALNFGEQDIAAGPSLAQTVTITNVGNSDLHVTHIALTGDDPAAFVIASGGAAVTMTNGSTHTVQVAFDPVSVGAVSATLTIQSDDSDEAIVNVALSGVGTSVSDIYTLTVAKDGMGSGVVTSDPAGIACGASCEATFAAGTPVTLTAAAANGSTFIGWTGAGCSGVG